ncbi:MAG: four helix bundle protein [Anaerolineales bacterium]|uniref:Four helix bundle protein n=1 Tax=Candidatus Desulfolinea nitratireducens TaxID=2841698 RepID=A0A8J6TF71_9CHLR|nr:four helix bundle protein [Candidatus Desulfolinea nitratireducens]MBL6960486.1 four helix bundle protein [Anaerolineales bacterium]
MSISGLEKLDVWRRSQSFAVHIHQEILPTLPKDEKWSLTQQIRRSSQSIPANIAEGHGRFYFQENVRFCYIARGSLEEVLSQLDYAFKVNYLPKELYQQFTDEGEKLNRLINGYIAFLKKSKRGANEPGSRSSIRENQEDYITE